MEFYYRSENMAGYRVLAIERQYGSSGLAVGEGVAKKLGIRCYGREILELTAKKLNVNVENIEHMEENGHKSLLYDLALLAQSSFTGNGLQADRQVFLEESNIIQEIAMKEKCVIVGRCAAGILHERKDCLRVFVYADLPYRIKTATQKYGVASDMALGVLKQNDKRRAAFYKNNTEHIWDNWSGYDLCLNSGTLGIEKCIDMIVNIMTEN